MHQLPEIHGICFVIRAAEKELTPFYEKIIKNWLSIFPKKAVENVFFIFTHSADCKWTPGAVTVTIKRVIKELEKAHDVKIPFSNSNICVIDNRSIKWMIAIKNGLSCPKLGEEELKACWNTSKMNLQRLLDTLAVTQVLTKKEIMLSKLLKEIGLLLQNESIESMDAKTLQKLLIESIFKIIMTSKSSDGHGSGGAAAPLGLPKLIEGLGLVKRAVKNEELKNKIDQLTELTTTEPKPSSQGMPPPRPEPPAPRPITPPAEVMLPQIETRRPQPPMRLPLPHITLPPPPTQDYPYQEDDEDRDEMEVSRLPPSPDTESYQSQLLMDIAEGIADNCEQGDLNSTYASELSSIQRAIAASSPGNIDFKDLTQALRVFEHNPKIGSKTKSNIREFLSEL